MPDQSSTIYPADRAAVARSTVSVQFKRLHPRAIMPRYHSDLAAGMDLSACLEEGQTVTVPVGATDMIPLGFAVALPPGYEAQVRPRSGLATKHGLTLPNSPGTVDADYRGEMKVAVINLGKAPFVIEHGMRIAQLIVAPVVHASFVEVDELDDTGRGTGGFGSTGVG